MIEDALIEVPTMRNCPGIDLMIDWIEDETMIQAFGHPLDKHELGDLILELLKVHLKAYVLP